MDLASGLMARSSKSSDYLTSKLFANITTAKELEVPLNRSDNICMMNKKEEIKYKDLLDCDWAVAKAGIRLLNEYDDAYKKYGKDDIITTLAYDDLKAVREARKTLAKAVRILRANDLYTTSS